MTPIPKSSTQTILARPLAALALVLVLTGGAAVLAWNKDAHATPAPPTDGAMAKFTPTPDAAPAPAVTYQTGSGETANFADIKGPVTLVNLWATWCAPCVSELPGLARLKTDREGPDFRVLTISEDREGAALVTKFLEDHHLAGLDHSVDPKSEIGRALKLRGLPTTILYDREGHELGRMENSADWSSPEARRLIDWYVAHGKAPVG